MVYTTDSVKERRKHTIRMKELVNTLDQGAPPTRSETIMHPRWYNKPYTCQLGQHELFTDVMMGVPFLTCRKCGWTTLKSAHDGTDTEHERKHDVPKVKPKTYLLHDIVDAFYPERRKHW